MWKTPCTDDANAAHAMVRPVAGGSGEDHLFLQNAAPLGYFNHTGIHTLIAYIYPYDKWVNYLLTFYFLHNLFFLNLIVGQSDTLWFPEYLYETFR